MFCRTEVFLTYKNTSLDRVKILDEDRLNSFLGFYRREAMNGFRIVLLFIISTVTPSLTFSHSGGLNKQGCHAGSKPYHCHRKHNSEASTKPKSGSVITGTVTHVRDGDTVEVNGVAIRLSALNCPENGTQKGNYATKVAKQFQGAKMTCELTGAKTYDRLVGYCSINGMDFGRYMMQNSSCKVWEKYDVWDRY